MYKTVPLKMQEKVERELESGENVEWIDMPIPSLFTPASIGAILFGIPWTAFAIFWVCGAAGFKMPDFSEGWDLFPLFGLPFVLIGLCMLSSPIWVYRKALKTVYAITNMRAIIIDGGFNTIIRSYYPEELTKTYRKEKSDGTGNIVIEEEHYQTSKGHQRTRELGFLRINNPREVEQILKELAKQS